MKNPIWLLLILALLVVGGVVAFMVAVRDVSPTATTGGGSSEPYALLLDASEAMRSRPWEIDLELAVDIPKGSESDNQDHQEISAAGVVDLAAGQGELSYDFQDLNNSGGFLGHFDIMDVLYAEGTGYFEIFQSGPTWLTIEPAHAANDQVSRFRDVMLTTPMLLSELLEAAAVSPEGSGGEMSREVSPSTLAGSDDQLGAGLGAAFEEVGVDLILVEATLSDDGISQVTVAFDYEVPEGRNEIEATFEVTPAEGDVSVEAPSESDTRDFSDIFN